MNALVNTIKKTIAINAPKEKVWEVLVQDEFIRAWYAEFSEGAYAETDWRRGSKAYFKDASGNGMVATVAAINPPHLLSVEFKGFLVAGKEDYESEGAQAVKGGQETYRLSENDGITQLAIDADMGIEWFDHMSLAWDRALEKIKELAESAKQV